MDEAAFCYLWPFAFFYLPFICFLVALFFYFLSGLWVFPVEKSRRVYLYHASDSVPCCTVVFSAKKLGTRMKEVFKLDGWYGNYFILC